MVRQRLTRRACLIAGALSLVTPLLTQAAPPMRVLVPGPPGSAMDSFMRVVSPGLSKELDRSIVIENIPSAGGIVATTQVARAPADGNMLLMTASNHAVNPSLFKSLPYDSMEDFTFVTVIGSSPLVLAISPTLTATTAAELIKEAKARPGELNFASIGVGSVLHLAGEMFNSQAGLQTTFVPYNEAGTLIADLANGQVHFAFLGVPTIAQLVKAGKVRALAVTSPQSAASLPEVPPLNQTLPQFSFEPWLAMFAPKGATPEFTQTIFAGLQTAMEDPAVKAAMDTQAVTPMLMPPTQVRAFVADEIAKYTALVKQAGITPQ